MAVLDGLGLVLRNRTIVLPPVFAGANPFPADVVVTQALQWLCVFVGKGAALIIEVLLHCGRAALGDQFIVAAQRYLHPSALCHLSILLDANSVEPAVAAANQQRLRTIIQAEAGIHHILRKIGIVFLQIVRKAGVFRQGILGLLLGIVRLAGLLQMRPNPLGIAEGPRLHGKINCVRQCFHNGSGGLLCCAASKQIKVHHRCHIGIGLLAEQQRRFVPQRHYQRRSIRCGAAPLLHSVLRRDRQREKGIRRAADNI